MLLDAQLRWTSTNPSRPTNNPPAVTPPNAESISTYSAAATTAVTAATSSARTTAASPSPSTKMLASTRTPHSFALATPVIGTTSDGMPRGLLSGAGSARRRSGERLKRRATTRAIRMEGVGSRRRCLRGYLLGLRRCRRGVCRGNGAHFEGAAIYWSNIW